MQVPYGRTPVVEILVVVAVLARSPKLITSHLQAAPVVAEHDLKGYMQSQHPAPSAQARKALAGWHASQIARELEPPFPTL